MRGLSIARHSTLPETQTSSRGVGLIAPLFKGFVNTDDPGHVELFKGFGNLGRRLTGEDRTNYVSLVNGSRASAPELTQDIARAAAAVLAFDVKMQGRNLNLDFGESLLVSVEGSPQSIGDQELTGGEIMSGIWDKVMPRELMRSAPVIKNVSSCTIVEVREILKTLEELGGDKVLAITHGYHLPRVDRMFKEESQMDVTVVVGNPEGVVGKVAIDSPAKVFLKDLVEAGAPLLRTRIKERVLEALVYRPLHFVSQNYERLTGESLEEKLANRARRKR